MDGIVFKMRENSKVINKTIYLAIGLNREARKKVRGMYVAWKE
jgi:transposase-like protein